jgi:hypothetical protein
MDLTQLQVTPGKNNNRYLGFSLSPWGEGQGEGVIVEYIRQNPDKTQRRLSKKTETPFLLHHSRKSLTRKPK